jgi:MFS family permease
LISLGLAFFSQAVGISAFLYYGSEIFMMTQADVDGIDEHEESAVILDDFIIGAFILGNLLSAFLIYKLGRRRMMLISLPITLISLLLLAYTMRESNYGDDNDDVEDLKQAYRHLERTFFIIVIVIYTLSVSIGLSTTVLGITAEILPSYLLSTGSAMTQSFGWVINFLINTFFLDILDDP